VRSGAPHLFSLLTLECSVGLSRLADEFHFLRSTPER